MNKNWIDPDFLQQQGEWFAAGFFEKEQASPFRRISLAIRRQLEKAFLPEYNGQEIYPSGVNTFWRTKNNILTFHYAYTLSYDRNRLAALIETATSCVERNQWLSLRQALDAYPMYSHQLISPAYTVGGRGWTHSIPDYGTVLRQGLASYHGQLKLISRQWPDNSARQDLTAGLDDVLKGIKCLHFRLNQKLPRNSPLARDFQIVPWRPARSFRQALLATNFIFYLDGCDSLGRFDVELGPYCEQDLKAGLITEKEAVAWVAALWKNFDANSGWNVALGGTLPDQRAAYNRLTMVCLKAIRKMRRPNLALRVRKDMPEKYFNQALAAIASGCGQPAFYHEEAYLQALQENHLNINFKDLSHYAFGGCTETMMHGMSNVGSLDGGLNLPGIMSKTLQRCLPGATSFKEILEALKQDISQNVSHLTTQVNHDQEQKAKYRPQPIRTLLVRDCLTAGREFNQGGARYNWSVINVGGLANVADSLAALKKLIFEEKVISPARFHQALTDNFQGWAQLLKEIKRCPRYGNDEDQADSLACEIASHVFRELTRYACWRGGRFLPGCLMFVTYVGAGENVPATPDGRLKDQPIADSIGPYFGREKKGPTAMLKSVAKLNQKMAAGTLVLNIRLAASFFSTATGRQAVKNLIRTYFSLGGMQVQVTVVDQAILKEAMKNPEKYQDLIVRVGGYSEYFTRLDRALQETIAARTEYSCP